MRANAISCDLDPPAASRSPTGALVRSAAAQQVIQHLCSHINPQADWLRKLRMTASPPPSWRALEEAAAKGVGSKAALRRALAPRTYPVPHFGTTAACKCRLAGTPAARRFASRSVNHFLAAIFLQLPGVVAGAGLPEVSLTRWDLHHAHIWAAPEGLGLLFHCKEYVAACEEFPADLGYCQRGSPLAFDSAAMDWRNVLWLGGQGAAINVGSSSALHEPLLMDGLCEARTLLESDFGTPLADVYYLGELGGRRPEHRLFVVAL